MGNVTLRVPSPGFAWLLVAVLAVIAIAVAVTGSHHGTPVVHVWHAHLLPALGRFVVPPPAPGH